VVKWRGGPAEGWRVARPPAQLGHVQGLVLVVEVSVRLVRHCAAGRTNIFYHGIEGEKI